MRPARIVFVDDEVKVCYVVSKTLTRSGLEVECFHHARDCLAHLGTASCDLLITDVKLPEMDGLALLRVVREQLPWLPVLVVTGYGDVAMAVRAMKAGAVDFIEKPLDRDTFLPAVQSVLDRNTGQAVLESCTLTRTERKVLYMLLGGKNNREIATALHRSHRTVEVHRGHLMQKLGVNSLIELLRRAGELGLLQWTPPPHTTSVR